MLRCSHSTLTQRWTLERAERGALRLEGGRVKEIAVPTQTCNYNFEADDVLFFVDVCKTYSRKKMHACVCTSDFLAVCMSV